MKQGINIEKFWTVQPMNNGIVVAEQGHYVDFKFWVS